MGKKKRLRRQKRALDAPTEQVRQRGVTRTWYYIIRYIAIAAMLIDHLGKVLYGIGKMDVEAFIFCNMVGRIAFPLFAFELVECFHFTKDRKKHLLQIGGLALISELPFDMAMILDDPLGFTVKALWWQNTCLSLFLAFLWLVITDNLRNNEMFPFYKSEKVRRFACRSMKIALIGLFAALAWILGADYTWRGIILVALFEFARGRKRTRLWQGFAIIYFVFSAGSSFLMYIPVFFTLLLIYLAESRKEAGEKGKLEMVLTSKPSRYFCRFFYPLHLAVLAVVRIILAT